MRNTENTEKKEKDGDGNRRERNGKRMMNKP